MTFEKKVDDPETAERGGWDDETRESQCSRSMMWAVIS